MTAALTEFLFGSPNHLYWSILGLAVLVLVGIVVAHLMPDYRRTIMAVGAIPVLVFAVSFVPLFSADEPPISNTADGLARTQNLLSGMLQAAPLMLAFGGLLYAAVIFIDDLAQARKRRSRQ